MTTQPLTLSASYPQETPRYTGLSFVIENRTNLRACKCRRCQIRMPTGQGHRMDVTGWLASGYVCPACETQEIALEETMIAARAVLDDIRRLLHQRDPLMGAIAGDEVTSLVYRADLQALQVAKALFADLEALEIVNYHNVRALIKAHKSQAKE